MVTGGSTPDTFGAVRRIPSVPYGPISDDGFGAVRRIPSTPLASTLRPLNLCPRSRPHPRVHVMPLRIFSCPRWTSKNGSKSTFPNAHDHVVSLIMVENSYITKSQELVRT